MFKRTLAAALIFGAAALAPPAAAQGMTCYDRESLTERLASKYQESLAAMGLQNSRQMLEVWTSPETGTFTVLITRADGRSCVVATGQHWNTIEQNVNPAGIAG